MKRYMIFAVFLLAACTAFAAVDSTDTLQLGPEMHQRYASSIATRFLTNYHGNW